MGVIGYVTTVYKKVVGCDREKTRCVWRRKFVIFLACEFDHLKSKKDCKRSTQKHC